MKIWVFWFFLFRCKWRINLPLVICLDHYFKVFYLPKNRDFFFTCVFDTLEILFFIFYEYFSKKNICFAFRYIMFSIYNFICITVNVDQESVWNIPAFIFVSFLFCVVTFEILIFCFVYLKKRILLIVCLLNWSLKICQLFFDKQEQSKNYSVP